MGPTWNGANCTSKENSVKFENYGKCIAQLVKCRVIKQLYSHFLKPATESHVLIHNLYRTECVQTNNCIILWSFLPTWCTNSLSWYIYYIPLHVSSTIVLIFRRTNCINTASCIVTPFRWLFRPQVTRGRESYPNLCTEQSPKESDDTRCCNNTIVLLKMSIIVPETCRRV